jgi:hypothetical protein
MISHAALLALVCIPGRVWSYVAAKGIARSAMQMSVTVNKFPCGVSSFKTIVEDKSFWSDNTGYIRYLERWGNHHRIHRPRGFGKTLLCDMLAEYYDKANSKEQVIFHSIGTFKSCHYMH